MRLSTLQSIPHSQGSISPIARARPCNSPVSPIGNVAKSRARTLGNLAPTQALPSRFALASPTSLALTQTPFPRFAFHRKVIAKNHET